MLSLLSESEKNGRVHRLGATLSVLRERPVEAADGSAEKKVAEVLVRWVPENQQVADAFYQMYKTLLKVSNKLEV